MATQASKPAASKVEVEPKERCGIVMPISGSDGYPESHWSDVLSIISESVDLAGFEPNLASNADEVGVIHKHIVQNLYSNPIVVCDVSSKNPNEMFELGLRLAFDKPTVIVKDDTTSYSFDTAAIEHLAYPRDLRFNKIVDFKERLTAKIIATREAAKVEGFSMFLKHFGTFKIAALEQTEVSGQEFILEELKQLRQLISNTRSSKPLPRLERTNDAARAQFFVTSPDFGDDDKIKEATTRLTDSGIAADVKVTEPLRRGGPRSLVVLVGKGIDEGFAKSIITEILSRNFTDGQATRIPDLSSLDKIIGSINTFSH